MVAVGGGSDSGSGGAAEKERRRMQKGEQWKEEKAWGRMKGEGEKGQVMTKEGLFTHVLKGRGLMK